MSATQLPMPGDERDQSADAALCERVKELTCLYEIAQLVVDPPDQFDEIMVGITEVVRRAWHYPDIANVRIVLDSREFKSAGFSAGAQSQLTSIMVGGARRGQIEVHYGKAMPDRDEGPFLKEERSLLETLAVQIASIVERREASEERASLQRQLRHADRLATLGQLAAGIGHELNEPLNNVLGFAQLVKRDPSLLPQVRSDIERIETAALQARSTIRKLLAFARQTPPQMSNVDVNRVVTEGMQFFEARCAKDNIVVAVELCPDLPWISADPSQLNQVLVNLVVNSLQAMPMGGRLTVTTGITKEGVFFAVEDTGIGMTDDVAAKLFVPFFTTKDVGEGTGLGLPVSHGIVSAHAGSIQVQSRLGQGTRITIVLPSRQHFESVEN